MENWTGYTVTPKREYTSERETYGTPYVVIEDREERILVQNVHKSEFRQFYDRAEWFKDMADIISR